MTRREAEDIADRIRTLVAQVRGGGEWVDVDVAEIEALVRDLVDATQVKQ